MSDISAYRKIINGVQTAVAAIQGQLPNMQDVETRFVSRFFEGTFDYLPVTLISCGDPDQTEMASFEAHRYKTFDVYIAVLYPKNQDDVGLLDTLLLWRERVENALDPPDDNPVLPDVDVPIGKVQVLPQEVINAQLAGRGYAYTGLAMRYTIAIERTREVP